MAAKRDIDLTERRRYWLTHLRRSGEQRMLAAAFLSDDGSAKIQADALSAQQLDGRRRQGKARHVVATITISNRMSKPLSPLSQAMLPDVFVLRDC